jgi:hypothetical protein
MKMQFTTHSLRFANIVSSGITIRMLRMFPPNLPPAMRARFDAAQQIDTSLPNDTYTKAEVDRLIRQAVFDAAHASTQQDGIRALIAQAAREANANVARKFAEELADHDEEMKIWCQIQLDMQRDELMAQSTSRPKPETQLTKPLPPPDQISKMEVELYENFHKPKAEKPKTQANVQLRIRINGQKGYWLIPLHQPNRSDGRKRIQPIMPHIDAIGRDTFRYAGCRDGDIEQAYIDTQNQLTMKIADQSFVFTQPKMKNDTDAKDAPPMRWFYPD